jgi:4-hydroxy-tetrahydrodipicolinate reductase
MPIPVAIAIRGASGRMGRALREQVAASRECVLAAALVRPGSPATGEPATADGGVVLAATLAPASPVQVLVDFTRADGFDAGLSLALERRLALVSGTTGLSDAQQVAMQEAAQSIPVLWSANFSLGVAVLARLVEQAGRWLPGWDCGISETHHRGKRDAPSGTALALGRGLAAARGQAFGEMAGAPHDAGVGAAAGAIGFASLRVGDVVGEHTVVFAGEEERLELTHRATDRATFARGALAAAAWLAHQPPGIYAMSDLLQRRAPD